MPAFYPENNKILPSDDSNRTLHKIASLAGGSGGGGGGSGAVQLYTDRDPAAPDNPALTAASFNSVTQVITWWPAGGAAWQ